MGSTNKIVSDQQNPKLLWSMKERHRVLSTALEWYVSIGGFEDFLLDLFKSLWWEIIQFSGKSRYKFALGTSKPFHIDSASASVRCLLQFLAFNDGKTERLAH